MSKEFERGIVIVGAGKVGKTIITQTDNTVVIGKETRTPTLESVIPLPQMDYTPYWDGKSARNKRREAARNAKKKRK